MTTSHTAEYAAILSTFLFLIKIYELVRDRFRIDPYLTIDGRESEKEVVITNLSSKAIHLKSFEMFLTSKRWFAKRDFIQLNHDQLARIQISAYATKGIDFSEQYNFGMKPNKNLYFQLKIAVQVFHCIKKI
ncbi:hypothetical protein GCM10023210_13940 [Chryseobacterium ginsengisoli]|uniref:Uncharacterized protein n=1 Tax=Chryseobacterium ginsengisoli TaxID=363853 RepID=A0ABP9M4L6_9FLAO